MFRSLLTLDLATQTGWCGGPPGGAFIGKQAIRHGSFRLGPRGASPLGVKLAALAKWLRPRIASGEYSDVAFEAPIDVRRLKRTTWATARLLVALPGVVECVAAEANFPDDRLREIEVPDISEALLGRRNIRSDDRKPMIVAWCRALGHDPEDDNAADAIALHAFMSAVLDPSLVPLLRVR